MTILGIGRKRLVKAMNITPDLRYGAKEKPTSSESDSCRAFFHTLYFKVAESLPDKFVRQARDEEQSMVTALRWAIRRLRRLGSQLKDRRTKVMMVICLRGWINQPILHYRI